jgi:hypothetical protein
MTQDSLELVLQSRVTEQWRDHSPYYRICLHGWPRFDVPHQCMKLLSQRRHFRNKIHLQLNKTDEARRYPMESEKSKMTPKFINRFLITKCFCTAVDCMVFSFFFFFISLGGVRLSPLGTSATVGLLYQPRMIDDDYGAVGGMRIGRGNRSTQRKPAPVPLCPPQIPHDLTRDGSRAAAVESQRLTA